MGRLPGKKYDLASVHGFDEELVRYGQRRGQGSRRLPSAQSENQCPPAVCVVEPPAFQSESTPCCSCCALPAALASHRTGCACRSASPMRKSRHASASVWRWGRPLVGLQVASFPGPRPIATG